MGAWRVSPLMWAGCFLGLLNNHYSQTALHCSYIRSWTSWILWGGGTKTELSDLLRSNTYTRRGKSRLDRRAATWCCRPSNEPTSPSRSFSAVSLERPRGSRKDEVPLPSCSVSDQGPPQEECNLGSKLKHNPKATRDRLSANHPPFSWAISHFLKRVWAAHFQVCTDPVFWIPHLPLSYFTPSLILLENTLVLPQNTQNVKFLKIRMFKMSLKLSYPCTW